MRQYSISEVDVGWQGLDFAEGLAAGSSIAEARNAPKYTQKTTGRGKVVRVRNPDDSGTMTLLVDPESKLHQDLLTIEKADLSGTPRVSLMTITDNSSKEVRNIHNAYIATQPDFARGTESATVAWVFNFESFNQEPVELGNAVGS